ncbi:MAG: 16S rRNA (uracil(1498)-N(3))-methyltransferase, partial [Geobacteraceae bacterium]|nr:16S rRNA (uracil(1498)-N(3))-methyltransferase [Geobacteraceae bacterium]
MRRFFASPELLRESSAILTDDHFRHISTVLRLKEGDLFILADGCGNEAVATITELGKGSLSVTLAAPYKAAADAGALQITLCQGLPKGEKMDLILQKGAELGAGRIIGFNAERSVARLDSDKAPKRIARWEKIIVEASRQCGRSS